VRAPGRHLSKSVPPSLQIKPHTERFLNDPQWPGQNRPVDGFLLEIIMRRYERASTLLTSDRPVEDWGKLLGDAEAVTAMLDRLLHHGHVLKSSRVY
jgi:DNA replication protein DnaC